MVKNKTMKQFSLVFMIVCMLGMSMHAQDNLSLSEAIQTGLQNNYDLQIIRNDEKIAHVNNSWGNSGALPTIDFSLSGTEDFNFNDDDNYRNEILAPELGLNWTIFDGFSVRITKRRYAELEELSKGNTAVLVESTIQDIISAYNNCILQKEMIDVYEKLMNLSSDRYNRELNSKALGASTTYTSLLAKTTWLEDKSTYLNQKVEFENAVRTLNYILGVKDNTIWNFTSGLTIEIRTYKLADLIDNMEGNNNTLKNQYINQSLLAKETALERSNLYPSLSVNAGVSHTNNNVYYEANSTNTDIKNKYTDVSVGLNLSYTIFNGTQRRRSLQIAKIEEESGLVEIEQMKHSLQNELLQMYSTYEVQKELVELANEQEEAAHLNLDIAEEKLKNGSMDSFDFRTIQINYLNASIQRFTAIYNLIVSNTDLLRISGGLINEYDQN